MYHVPWIALISAKRWQLDVLTFLIHVFAVRCFIYEQTLVICLFFCLLPKYLVYFFYPLHKEIFLSEVTNMILPKLKLGSLWLLTKVIIDQQSTFDWPER